MSNKLRKFLICVLKNDVGKMSFEDLGEFVVIPKKEWDKLSKLNNYQ